jgi:hypothetical protein
MPIHSDAAPALEVLRIETALGDPPRTRGFQGNPRTDRLTREQIAGQFPSLPA